jgi:probable biosynthetic protein (TIGR04098 family)
VVKKYIESLKNALPSIKEEELTMPVSGTSLDSIDLVLLRVTLEKLMGKEIPNNEWQGFTTIQDAISFCINNQNPDGTINRNTKSIVTDRKYSIGMPQMANSALSENWLFKELGDIHWELLSKGLNTQSANFTDEFGKRLYAAFTRIHIANFKLNEFKENENIEFNGIIKRFGLSTYVSKVIFGNGKQKSQAVLMTSFSTRDSLDNSRLFKSQPYTKENYVPEFEYTPQMLNDYRLQRKGLLETFKIHHEEIILSTSYVHKMNYTINPFYEINGVGLLYFASYPIISDKCEADYFNQTLKYKGWERRYYTLERDVFYFANCNIDDSISYRLNSYEFLKEGKIKLFSSLYRVSDMALMANIFTIKQNRTD